MFDGLLKLAGIETAEEKQAREAKEAREREAWQVRMRQWQSQYTIDPSIRPHAVATLAGHSDCVWALTVLPDGGLASGSLDKTIKLWEVLSGRCMATLEGHSNDVNALTVLPDGRLASGSGSFVGSKDNTIKLWEVLSGRCMATLEGHSSFVIALTVLPDGRLASGSVDKTIKLWEVLSGRCMATLAGHSNTVRALTVLPDGRLASGSKDNTIKLWEVLSGRCMATLAGHSHWVCALTVLPDGRLASGSWDNTIKLWEVLSGRCMATLAGHSDGVIALTVLPDGRLASGSRDKTIKLWEVLSGRCMATLEGHSYYSVTALTVLPDGRLASGSRDNTIKLWDVGLRTELDYAAEKERQAGELEAKLAEEQAEKARQEQQEREQQAKSRQEQAAKEAAELQRIQGVVESCQALRQRWPVDKQKGIVTAYEELIQAHPDDSCYYRELAEYYVYCADSASEQVQKKVAYKKAIPYFESAIERDLSDTVAAERFEAVTQQLAVLTTSSPHSSHEKGSLSTSPVVTPPPPPPSSTITSQSDHTAQDALKGSDTNQHSTPLFIAQEEVTLGREIGKGGVGMVYEGTYAFQKVAIKKYNGTRMPEKEARAMRAELDIMHQLQHECLVRLFGFVCDEKNPAMIVMEYGANGSLHNFLHSERDITWGLRLRIADELARGLAYLHHKKIIHRDIKSLNVVLDKDFHAKWCDFGLAVLKLHTATTTKPAESSHPVGTVRWMAPELFSRKTSKPSTASDIWALGMVFFELASREVPYAETKEDEQVKEFIKEADGEDVPEECQTNAPQFGALMQRCWAERTHRPSAAEIVETLNDINRTFTAEQPSMTC